MQHIFKQYKDDENQMTHCLMSCLHEDRELLKGFLNQYCKGFFDKPRYQDLELDEQTLPDMPNEDSDEGKTESLPDGVIYNTEKCIFIESKIKSDLNKDQIKRHFNSVQKKRFEREDIKGIIITVDEKSPIENCKMLTWREIYEWFHQRKDESSWAEKLVRYFEIKERQLQEVTLTKFTGINFDNNNPYSSSEGYRVLRLLLEKIKNHQDLWNIINMKKEHAKKPSGESWTYLIVKSPHYDDSANHTKCLHYTISTHENHADAAITLPNGLVGKIRKNLKNLSREEFKDIIEKITQNIVRNFEKTEIDYRPFILIQQRRGKNQKLTHEDALLLFDMRTVFQDFCKDVETQKHQPEWLDCAYDIMTNKKSNLQMQVRVTFPYGKNSLINHPNAENVFVKALLAFKPLIDKINK